MSTNYIFLKGMETTPTDSATMEAALKDALQTLNCAHKKFVLNKSAQLSTECESVLQKINELIAQFSPSVAEELHEFKIPVLDEDKNKSNKRSRQEEFVEFLKEGTF